MVRLYYLPSRISQCSSGGCAETFGFATEQYIRSPVDQHILAPHLHYIIFVVGMFEAKNFPPASKFCPWCLVCSLCTNRSYPNVGFCNGTEAALSEARIQGSNKI